MSQQDKSFLPSILLSNETSIISGKNEWDSNLPPLEYKPVPTFQPNEMIMGRYLVKEIVKGGFGEVYHCYDKVGQRDVALKTVSSKQKQTSIVYRFFAEISMRLEMRNHPNVLRLRNVELIRGYPYLVSDWVEGDSAYGISLRDWMNKKKLTAEEVVTFSFHILFGLKTCHEQLSTNQQDYVYGDLKPENVAISKDRKGILMDFSVGAYTKGYESPEMKTKQSLDFRHDIYCFGLVLNEMAQHSLLSKSEQDTLKPVIQKCIALRDIRFASFEELQTALEEKVKSLNIEIPKDEGTLPLSSLDSYYIWRSKLRLGITTNGIPQFDSSRYYKSDGKYQKYPYMKDFIEYVRDRDLEVAKADAYLIQGDYANAKNILNSTFIDKTTQNYYIVWGKLCLFENDIERALEAFKCANESSIHLQSLDFLIDLLNHNPKYREKYNDFMQQMYARLNNEITNRPDGAMLFSVYGKWCMYFGNTPSASSFFRESLKYPSPSNDSWNTNFLLGISEQTQKHVYQATISYQRTVSEVKADQKYRQNIKKATTILFSLLALSRIQEAEEEMVSIRETFGLDYKRMIDDLRKDLRVFDQYLQKMNKCGSEKESLSKLFEEVEGVYISCVYLKTQILVAISSRIMDSFFREKDYMRGIAVGERTRGYDVYNPNLLYNEGCCYYMNGQYEEARNAISSALQYTVDPSEKELYKNALGEVERILIGE